MNKKNLAKIFNESARKVIKNRKPDREKTKKNIKKFLESLILSKEL